MTTRRTLATALGLAAAALGAGLAGAAPASAGGIIAIASPSFANSCASHGTTAHHTGSAEHGSGIASGLLAALPAGTPLNHCGGADLPLPNASAINNVAFGNQNDDVSNWLYAEVNEAV
ncbi:hypothetical protein [Streptomyces sp. NPDC014733]|uniref:hypothetical protein n=1 Tax=Streptomyces sp. NPDC014733 TaxID=3364885 RepID=UPI0036FC5474